MYTFLSSKRTAQLVVLVSILQLQIIPVYSFQKEQATDKDKQKVAQAHVNKGRGYYKLAKFRLAVDSYSKAIHCLPYLQEAFLLRAEAYGTGLGLYDKQLSDITSAININPNNAGLYAKRARVNYELLRLQEALRDSTKALERDPLSLDALRIAAVSNEDLGLFEKSVQLRTKLARLTNNAPMELISRARCYVALQKPEHAAADINTAITSDKLGDKTNVQRLCMPLINYDRSWSEWGKTRLADKMRQNAVRLPFHYDSEGHICLPVQIDTHSSELIVDTGALHSTIWTNSSIAKNYDLKTTQNSEDYESQFTTIGHFRIGSLDLENFPMALGAGLPKHETAVGMFGGNVLENFAVRIDYSKKQVSFTSSSQRSYSPHELTVPMIIRDHRPYCKLILNDKLTFEALLDTGLTANIAPDSLLKSLSLKKLVICESMEGPFIGFVCVGYDQLNELKVPPVKIKQPVFAIFPADFAPHLAKKVVLGNAFLSGFRSVTFDFPARQIVFEPYASQFQSPANLILDARYYASHGQETKALQNCSKAMAIDGDFKECCYWLRATTLMDQRQYQKAVLDLTALIKLNPKDLKAYQYRAKCYRNLRQYQQQIADDSAQILLKPSTFYAYVDRAWAYERLGKKKLADKDRRTAKLNIDVKE